MNEPERAVGHVAMNTNEERDDQLKEAQHRVSHLEQLATRDDKAADLVQGELRESDDRFLELVGHLHQVFWIVDAKTDRLLYISPAYQKIWGRSCQSLYMNDQS